MPRTNRCAGVPARSVSDSATTATRHCLSCLVQLGVAGLGAFVATSVVGPARPVGSEAGRASARPGCSDPTPRRRRRLDEVTRVGRTARDAFVAQLGTLSELRPPRRRLWLPGRRQGPRQPRGPDRPNRWRCAPELPATATSCMRPPESRLTELLSSVRLQPWTDALLAARGDTALTAASNMSYVQKCCAPGTSHPGVNCLTSSLCF
jgi:hypothetical protein